jgi:hypothetical protein
MNIWNMQSRLISAGHTLLNIWAHKIAKYTNAKSELTISLYDRPVIEYIAKNYQKASSLIGVEIGVYLGNNAIYILTKLNIKKLFLVDPYLEYEDYKTNDGWTQTTQHDFDENFRIAAVKLEHYKEKVEFIRKKSEDAAADIHDDLDFVYIDGNHEYEFVKHDIELYYPKLKPGGVLGGDNFGIPDVACAAIEFAFNHNLNIHGAKWTQSYEWLVIKE